jgi:hypothetical protein
MPGFKFFSYPNTKGRDIICEDELLEEYKKQMNESENSVLYKIWPKEKGIFPTDNIVWKNKIAFIDLVGYPSGIIMENEAMVKSFIMWFNALWSSLK